MFAASKSASGGTLITRTFTSSTTWTAPTITNTILTMSGYGGAAVSDAYSSSIPLTSNGASRSTIPSQSSPYAQWADIYSTLNTAIAKIVANVGVNYLAIDQRYVYVRSDDSYYAVQASPYWWISGNSYTVVANNSPPTSGNILYSSLQPTGTTGWDLYAAGYILGATGGSTTGVGKTFPGGTLSGSAPYRTAVAPSTTTFTNVTVTPGASYSIVVPSGGSLTITYIG